MKKYTPLLCILLLILGSVYAPLTYAQDTPQPIREAAITALNTQFPGIGRPQGWQHTIITAQDSGLGCNLVQPGTPLNALIEVYVVTLTYPAGTFVYHVSSDAQRVLPCDSKLFDTTYSPFSTGSPNAPCSAAATALSRLRTTQQALVSGTGANVRTLPDPASAAVTNLPTGTNVYLLAGPFCTGNYLYWFVDYGGARGYVLEVDFNNTASPTYALQLNTTPQTNFPTTVSTPVPVTGGTGSAVTGSRTCPAGFTGYLAPRLAVGMTGQVEPGGVNNIMRQSYGRSSQPTGTEIPPTGIFNVVGGPECTGANTGEAIVWWQVTYNGVTGWTAESLNGVYFLQPYGAVTAPSAGGAGATGSNFVPKGPAASLVLPPSLNLKGSRTVISTANAGQLQNAGEFLFPEYIGRAVVANNGTLVTWISGGAGYNNLLFYDSLANFSLSSSREQVFSSGEQSFLALSPAGDLVALGISTAGLGVTGLSVQDRNGAERLNLPQSGGAVPKAVFNSDSSILAYILGASGSPTTTLNVANVSFQTTRALSNTQDFVSLAFSNDGSLLAAVASNGQVTLWDGRTLAERGSFATGLSGRDMSLAVNSNGTRVAVAGNTGVVQIWDAASRTKVLEPRVFQTTQSGIISALTFSPNGSLLAAGGYTNPAVNNTGNNVVIFDANTGTQLSTLIGLRLVFGLGFSAAGDVLMGYDDYSITFWTIP